MADLTYLISINIYKTPISVYPKSYRLLDMVLTVGGYYWIFPYWSPWGNYQEIIIVLVTAVVIAAVVVIKLVNASESCYLRMEAKFVEDSLLKHTISPQIY